MNHKTIVAAFPLLLILVVGKWAFGDQQTVYPYTWSSTNSFNAIRSGVDDFRSKQQTMNTELYTYKADASCFVNSSAFNTCFALDWPTGFDVSANYTLSGTWNFSGATVIGISGGSMTWPSSTGIAVYGGSSAWGTSLTVDTDLSSVSTSDDSVPSAKATKAALDSKANSSGISFVASSLSDLKYDPDTNTSDDEYNIITNTGSVGDANDATVVPTLERAGILFQSSIIQAADCSTYVTEGQLCVQY